MTAFDLNGKVALVTGASSGLGHRFALTLARAGAHVAIAARRTERLADLQAEIEAFDGRALPIKLDVRDPDDIAAAVDGAETELGPIGILVNNAGVAVQKPAQDFTAEDYDFVMDTNLKGSWFLAQSVGKRMISHGHGGKIINIASVLALRVVSQLALYAMSKAAVAQMTKALALEWSRYDIQVNAICPGYIETEMNRDYWQTPGGQALINMLPRRRVGQPDVLDGTLLLLASAQSDFMTGAVIPVDDAQTLM